MAKEHQEYIQTKVNPTLETLVTQVLLGRPDNPVPFMIEWLAKQTKASPSLDGGEAEKLRQEIKTLQAEIGDLEKKLATAGGDAEADEEDEEDDVDDADLPPPPAYLKKGPRASVSAEAYGAWNQHTDFTPPVYPKSAEQSDRIKSVLTGFLFEAMSKADLDVLVNAMVEQRLEVGDRIIQEGDDGEVMYVIEQGAFDCIKKIDGMDKVVKKCVPGDVFGELALLYNCPRAASVEAREKAVVWSLDRQTFNHIVKGASMKKRELYEGFIKTVPILEPLNAYERGQLADSLHKERVNPGDYVIRQGEEGLKMYFVETGTLSAQKARDAGAVEEVLTYKDGDYFGELALMRSEVRAASVIATSPCDLLWIDKKTFDGLLGSLGDAMMKTASGYKQ